MYRRISEEKETNPFLASIAAVQENKDIDLWPENVRSVMFFAGLGMGAWNHSMNGPCGLRYEAMPFLFEMAGIQKKKQLRIYADLLVMESAALKAMHSK